MSTQLSITFAGDTFPHPKGAVFARHETFHPRFGWLKKGFDACEQDGGVFDRDDATVVLGVGKNMVRSIAYWTSAFKLVLERKDGAGRAKQYSPTELGTRLLGQKGWDPFLEDLASLWLLHWYLLRPPCYATTWYYAFNVLRDRSFTGDDLYQGLKDYQEAEYPLARAAASSLKKDSSCLLRMYTGHGDAKSFSEDSIDSPFVDLGIIYRLGEEKRYAFQIGAKPTLPPEVIVAACLDYASIVTSSEKTIAVSRLLYDHGSPGMAFKLTESVLSEAIESVARTNKAISFSESSGLMQMAFSGDPAELHLQVLSDYYAR